jgi:signal transduction histidine kinase
LKGEEADRQGAIARFRLGGLGREPAFDHVTTLAANMFGMPLSVVTVLGQERQYFGGACGLDLTHTSREVAFCDYAVRQPGVMVVSDARADARFSSNPLVMGQPYIRFYAGAPIRMEGSIAVGSLCLMDSRPRAFTADDERRLEMLAEIVADIMELRAGSLAAQERQEALQRETDLLKATVQNIEQGIALFDPQLRMILWNDLFFDLFGYPASLSRRGTSAAKLIRITASRGELGADSPDGTVAALIESIQRTSSNRMQVVRNNGRVLDVWRSTMADGRFIITATDVTEQRRLTSMKDEFVSTVNHELRTPLTSILGSLSLLHRGLGGPLSPRGEQLVSVAMSNGQRLSQLINDLLDIEKLGSGASDFQMERVELGLLLEQAIEQNRPYSQSFNVSLTLLPAGEPLWIKGDARRLTQALSNLLSNAVKFSPAGAAVQTAICRQAERARVAVSDKGPGIPEELRPRLFSRFAQASGSNGPNRLGTGLGLAITKAIVEGHGGSIDYETQPARGTTFFFDLPLAEAPAEETSS